MYANEAAIDHYSRALSIGAGRGDAYLVHESLGELLTTTGQYEHALEHLDRALSLAIERSDRDAQVLACRWIAQLYERRGEYVPAFRWIQRGLTALDGEQTAEAAELLIIGGLIYTRQGDYENALDRCYHSLRIADKLGDATVLARTYSLLGHVANLRDQITAAIEHFQRALDLYEQAGDIRGQALSHNMLATAYDSVGQWQEAERYYHQAREVFEQMGDVYNRAFVDNNLGEIARTQGRLDEALASYQAGLHAVEQIGGSLWVLGGFHNNLGATLIRRGEIDTAREHLRISQEYFERAQARDWLPELHCHWAEAALCVDELAEAEAQAEEGLSLARELEMRREEGTALRILGEVATAQGQFGRAEEHIDQSLAILESVGDEYRLARSQLSLARLALETGSTDEAQGHLAQAIETFEKLGAQADLTEAQSLTKQLLPKQ